MKILKFLLFTIIGIIAIALIVALFLPSNYQIERSTVVNAPTQLCYENVADLNHYKEWNPWSRMEPSSKQIVHDPARGLNAKWEWEGEKIGKGMLTIVKAQPHTRLETHLQFKKPMKSESNGYWIFEAAEGGTKITWGNKGQLDYPMGRFFGLGLEDMLGKDFEDGLANLKEYIESKPVAPAVNDSITTAQDSIITTP